MSVDIITALLLVGLAVGGYFLFMRKKGDTNQSTGTGGGSSKKPNVQKK